MARDEATQRAAKFIEQLKPAYLEWLRTDVEILERAISNLKETRGSKPGDFDAVYRQSSIIRDLGTSFGYASVTEVADSLCELIRRLEENAMYHQPAIDTHFRSLQLVGSSQADAVNAAVDKSLIDGLRKIIGMFPNSSACDRRRN